MSEEYSGFDLTLYNLFTLLREMYYTRGETETNFLQKSGGTVAGSLTIQGNLVVNGQSYSIDTENLKVGDYTITLAKDNEQTLTSMVGMVVPKYDGTNYGFFGWDADGYAYVGDLTNYDGTSAITLAENTSLQKIATIKDTATGTTSDDVMVYDQTNKVFKKAPSGRYVIEDNELVASNDNKALYNVGAFDSEDGKTRQTGYETPQSLVDKSWTLDGAGNVSGYKFWCYIPSAYAIQSDRLQLVINSSDLEVRGDIDTAGGIRLAEPSGSITQTRLFINVSSSVDTVDKLKAWISNNNLQIQYKLATSYTEDIIENESILPLDSNMANKIRQKVVDGLNLFDINGSYSIQGSTSYSVSGNTLTVSGEWYVSRKINVIPNTQYTLSLTLISASTRYSVAIYDEAITNRIAYIDSATSISFNSGNNSVLNILFYCGNGGSNTGTSVYSNIMLNEGNHPYPYSDFNQKEHITNDEAKLLKKEEEKCRNLINESALSNNVAIDGSSGGAVSYSGYRASEYFIPITPNTYYSKTTNIAVYFYDNNYNYIANTYIAYNFVTFLSPSSAAYLRIECNSLSGQIMLNYGDHAIPYQEYNGAIVHKKDIEPVLLWENSSPTSSFANQTITTKDMSAYKYIVVEYKYAKGSSNTSQFAKLKYLYQGDGFALNGMYIPSGEFASRLLYFSDTTHIVFSDTSLMSGSFTITTNNDYIIPIAIYGTNVL